MNGWGTDSLSNIAREKSAMSSEMRSIGLIQPNVNVKVLILWIKKFYVPRVFIPFTCDQLEKKSSEVFIGDYAGCSV